jgi:hypothetical protein
MCVGSQHQAAAVLRWRFHKETQASLSHTRRNVLLVRCSCAHCPGVRAKRLSVDAAVLLTHRNDVLWCCAVL